MDKLFEIEKLRCSYDKDYREGESKVVLEIDHLCIPKGKRVFIVGESGIGKSTILETLGLMNNTIVPSKETKVLFYDKKDFVVDLAKLWQYKSEKRLSEFRLKNYSFIFQSTNLMRNFTAFENISFTRMLQGYTKFSCFKRTRKVLADLGLEHVGEERMAQELSGGQQQRLAFARAILPDFTVLFGDEPTGNLDAENAVRVIQVLSEKLEELGDASAIIVSHDMHLAVSFADVIIKIRKEIRPKKHDYDEDVMYGVIDDSCVFVPDVEEGFGWTNGIDTYPDQAFEMYLRKK
ncbi:MAG: ATP-binding cassette domain-containing protein [Alistipes sp.]|nr:ATP-binding cassette domain-containing protein [Alistipes sp.]